MTSGTSENPNQTVLQYATPTQHGKCHMIHGEDGFTYIIPLPFPFSAPYILLQYVLFIGDAGFAMLVGLAAIKIFHVHLVPGLIVLLAALLLLLICLRRAVNLVSLLRNRESAVVVSITNGSLRLDSIWGRKTQSHAWTAGSFQSVHIERLGKVFGQISRWRIAITPTAEPVFEIVFVANQSFEATRLETTLSQSLSCIDDSGNATTA